MSKEHWEEVYQTKDHTKVGWFQEHAKRSLLLFTQIEARPTHSIIDVGCGASRLVDELIEKGFSDLTLLDLSQSALESVKDRLGTKAKSIEFICADITNHTLKQKFDIWHDRAVFHFLTKQEDQRAYMRELSRALSPNGYAIIGTFAVEGPLSCSGLEIVQYDESKMKSVLGEELELLYMVDDTHMTPSNTAQAYSYFVIRHKTSS